MILVIGEILFDIFPKYKRIGGAPFNFACHLRQLGYSVRFISRVGMDDNGEIILDQIKKAGFSPGDIQLDPVHPTGTVQVGLDKNGVPEFDITANVAYDYLKIEQNVHAANLQNIDLIYFGTLIQRNDPGFNQMQRFLLRKSPNAITFYDVNLRPGCYSDKVIEASLYNTDVLKINDDELSDLKRITGIDQTDHSFIRYLMTEYFMDAVALTKGYKGSELYTSEGFSHASPEPIASLVDTVGAGDAYAAVLAAGILEKWTPDKTIAMATAFASRICTIKGAIPETKGFYEPILKLLHSRG